MLIVHANHSQDRDKVKINYLKSVLREEEATKSLSVLNIIVKSRLGNCTIARNWRIIYMFQKKITHITVFWLEKLLSKEFYSVPRLTVFLKFNLEFILAPCNRLSLMECFRNKT